MIAISNQAQPKIECHITQLTCTMIGLLSKDSRMDLLQRCDERSRLDNSTRSRANEQETLSTCIDIWPLLTLYHVCVVVPGCAWCAMTTLKFAALVHDRARKVCPKYPYNSMLIFNVACISSQVVT